jgi:3-oxoacyl-[acyl-carrier-protein] synthase III
MHLPIVFEGTGAAVPTRIRLSSELDAEIGKPSGWLYRRTGVFSRHVCESEDQVDLAVAASRQALAQAGIAPTEVDVILFAAAVPYQSIPATAPLVQQRLGIADGACAAFDINSTCLSFLTAVDVLASLLTTGRYRRGLIVASEIASRALPWAEAPETAALFGDGAAAAVLSAGDGRSRLVAAAMETHPSAFDACQIGSGGTRYDYHTAPGEFSRHARFEMEGDVLFKTTMKHFPGFLDRLLAEAGWDRADVDVVVPHQASPGALAHLARRSGFRPDVVVDIARDVGNQVAASLPTALHAARVAGRLGKGARALLLGTSAGISFGGLALVT